MIHWKKKGLDGEYMKAVLMHKNISVAAIEYTDGHIIEVNEILDKEHMPVGTYRPGMINGACCAYLKAWQRSRAIPGDRVNLAAVLDSSGKDIFQLGVLAHGMGLTDHYWVCGADESATWEEISFHRNGFIFSSLTLTGEGEVTASPDYETNGSLAKAWVLADGIPVLLKDSPDWLPTASANEAAACRIAQACGIAHAIYYPVSINGKTYCASPCFVDSDHEEFVSLLQFMRTNWGQTAEAAAWMGLDHDFINKMTAFDLLIGNTDRHEGNFGIMVSPDTMQPIRPAPLFDSGTSLHQWTGGNTSFKPFFREMDSARKSLQEIPFPVPEDTVLRDIITGTYAQFGVEQYAQKAAEELLRNADLLRRQQERLFIQRTEEDICL